ncbi:MAG: hypothetical protein EP343_25185 [Deltaproteobacteria bacterium]|nr:MAG: hypothetical protein EP343_25185 [Deltaproteobacteria bacterium]
MIPGINLISWQKGIWTESEWQSLDDRIRQAHQMGFGAFRVWVHFNYTNTFREEGGAIRLAPECRDALLKRAPLWPGEILLDWSWGYYDDKVRGSWVERTLQDHFGEERQSWSMGQSWTQDLIAGHFRTLRDDWSELLNKLANPKVSLSVGNEIDGLLRTNPLDAGEQASFAAELAALNAPFTAGWKNEYSFDSFLLEALPEGAISRFSHYEKNESDVAKLGSLSESPLVQRGRWGVAEFGINKQRRLASAIKAMEERVEQFKRWGANDVFLWSWGAGDEYEWQMEERDYVDAFLAACNDDIA